MSKKRRVHFELSDVKHVRLNEKEINVILRASDDIIFEAGRSMLAKILKGSKSKQLYEYHLNESPSYGYFHDKTIEEITVYIDWMIVHDYLAISYNGQLPMITFAEKGWECYKPIYAEELYYKILNVQQDEIKVLIEALLNANREVIVILINKIGFSKNIGFIRFLEEWESKEAKKVRLKLSGALRQLKSV